jgi:hypothetical protein
MEQGDVDLVTTFFIGSAQAPLPHTRNPTRRRRCRTRSRPAFKPAFCSANPLPISTVVLHLVSHHLHLNYSIMP